MKKYDVAIVGGGVLGASTFHSLAKAGASVCLIEKEAIGSGVTAYSGGVIRTFHLSKEQRKRALFSLDYFMQFKENVGRCLDFKQMGYLYFPAPEAVSECKTIVQDNEVSRGTSWLTAEQLLTKFPYLQKDELKGAVWEPLGGYMDPIAVTKAWVEAGEEHGGDVYQGVEVLSPIVDGDKDTSLLGINTNLGEIMADKMVVAAGTHSLEILKRFDCSAPIYNKTIQVDIYQSEEIEPTIPCFTDVEFDLNGRGGSQNILLGTSCLPGVEHEIADRQQQTKSRDTAKKRFRWLENSHLFGSHCSTDTFSDRELGYADYIGTNNQVLLLTGFNGTAFKFAPYLGERIKQLTLNNSEGITNE